MSESVKVRAMRAMSWSFVQDTAQRVLQFGITIFLARLLAPAEFGLIAMLSIFIAVAQALVDGGFGSALIQRKNPTGRDESSVFFFNILIGFALTATLYVSAPFISRFYHQPELTVLTRALSVVLIINSFSAVQSSLMIKRMDFKKQALISVVATMVSGLSALLAAWRGLGVWALVSQQVTNAVVRTVLLWVLNSWRPELVFDFSALRRLYKFGSRMVASVLLNTFFENLYPLVIGRFFAVAELGYYNRAYALQYVTSRTLSSITNRVTFPLFSEIQNDLPRLKRGLRKAIATIGFIHFPMMAGLAAVGKPLLLVLLTEKWAPAIPYLQLLCFASLLHPMQVLNLNILMALGKSDLFLRLEILKRVLLLANLLITFRWGIQGMIWGQIFYSVIALYLNAFYTGRLIDYSLWDQIRDVAPYLAAAGVMGLIVAFVDLPGMHGNMLTLAVKLPLGAGIYLALCAGFRLSAVSEIHGLLVRRVPAAA